MDTGDIAGIKRECRSALAQRRYRDFCDGCLILADAVADEGHDQDAARYRNLAGKFRTPGVLWPGITVEGLSEHQADQWAYASARPFGLLTGTPGTGKTYTVGAEG
jgi:hypothetical protein